MTKKREKLPPLTDAERHARFLELAREAEASDDPDAFDRSLRRVTASKPGPAPTPRKRRRES